MQINTDNKINFSALNYVKTPALDKALSLQNSTTLEIIKKAEEALAKTKSNVKLLSPDGNLIVSYVDFGDYGLSYIDGAVNSGNILKVGGYIYDTKNQTGLRNTRYTWIDIPLKNKKIAEKYVNSINNIKANEMYLNRFLKAIEVAKALDERI